MNLRPPRSDTPSRRKRDPTPSKPMDERRAATPARRRSDSRSKSTTTTTTTTTTSTTTGSPLRRTSRTANGSNHKSVASSRSSKGRPEEVSGRSKSRGRSTTPSTAPNNNNNNPRARSKSRSTEDNNNNNNNNNIGNKSRRAKSTGRSTTEERSRSNRGTSAHRGDDSKSVKSSATRATTSRGRGGGVGARSKSRGKYTDRERSKSRTRSKSRGGSGKSVASRRRGDSSSDESSSERNNKENNNNMNHSRRRAQSAPRATRSEHDLFSTASSSNDNKRAAMTRTRSAHEFAKSYTQFSVDGPIRRGPARSKSSDDSLFGLSQVRAGSTREAFAAANNNNSNLRRPSQSENSSSSFANDYSSNNGFLAASSNKAAAKTTTTAKAQIGTMISSGKLVIKIIQGRKLTSMNRNLLGIRSHSDPFVQAFFDGRFQGATSPMHHTINPIWKGANVFVCEYDGGAAQQLLKKNEDVIELRLFDYDNKGGKHGFMGSVFVPLLPRETVDWYAVRPTAGNGLTCENDVSGDLQVHVEFTAKSYVELEAGHSLPLRNHQELVMDISWEGKQRKIETSCVAVDNKQGRVLWNECVHFGSPINVSRTVARTEDKEPGNATMSESLVFELGLVPANVGAFFVILSCTDPRSNLTQAESFKVSIKDTKSGEGIAVILPIFEGEDSSMVLLRIAYSADSSWTLAPILKGYPVFREFGSMLPQLQELASDIIPSGGNKPAERTAVMRPGDSLQLLDYVTGPLPKKLVVGLFWEVANGERLKAAASLMDKELREVDAIHKAQQGSYEGGVQHQSSPGDFEKFEISFAQLAENVHYLCFVLGPCNRQKLDTILKVACHIVDPAEGTELARCTLSKFDHSPTKSIALGTFYRSGNEWHFTVFGASSDGPSFAGRLNEIRTRCHDHPLQPAPALPHTRRLKSTMPPSRPLPQPALLF